MSELILSITGQHYPAVDHWGDYQKIKLDDADPALYGMSGAPNQTEFLYAAIDPSQLPTGATLLGLKVKTKLRMQWEANSCRDVNIEFLNDMVLVSENKKNAANYPQDFNYHYYTYGNSTDMWNTALTTADLNSGDVWFRFKCERYSGFVGLFFYMDYIEITAYYEGETIPVVDTYGPTIQVI